MAMKLVEMEAAAVVESMAVKVGSSGLSSVFEHRSLVVGAISKDVEALPISHSLPELPHVKSPSFLEELSPS